MKSLQRLDLAELRISDEGLRILAEFPRLTSLTLDAASVQGTNFEPLAKGTKLETLSLSGDGFGDRHMEGVVKAFQNTRLESLWVSSRSVTTVGERYLRGMENGERVHFSRDEKER
ncbi:MAG: hypothetical protein U0903_05415 [Planctomycetales bacterium]